VIRFGKYVIQWQSWTGDWQYIGEKFCTLGGALRFIKRRMFKMQYRGAWRILQKHKDGKVEVIYKFSKQRYQGWVIRTEQD
jgi:hypothetical protein